MLVGERMTHNPLTVSPETPVSDLRELMQREKVSHIPVLDRHQTLAGIVTEKDIARVSPSPATSLNIWEITSLLSQLKVQKVMKKDVITVSEDTPIEDAARIMADQDVSGLPVMRGNQLVGLITEKELFKIFVELFGARTKGLRLTLLLPEKKGELAALTSAISEQNGNIVSIGTFLGEDPSNALCTVKVEGIDEKSVRAIVNPLVLKIIDIREM
jgi:acetoin utilization protein AcuB